MERQESRKTRSQARPQNQREEMNVQIEELRVLVEDITRFHYQHLNNRLETYAKNRGKPSEKE
jgi:hypothetical protein